SGDFNFKVFGIEMVYANQDTVQMGDGNISGAFYLNPITITAAKQASGLTGGELYSGSPAIPAAFPMGFGAIYAMKYEATMEQWVDFLNTLTYDQQNTRIDIAPNAAANTRAYTVNPSLAANNTIEVVVPGLNNTQPAVFGCDYTQDNVYNTSNDGQNIPFVSGSKSDILAYLDWSGLRPLSEMEFEKLCRGPRPRVSTEFAWGSTALATRTRVNLINSGTANEVSNATVVNGQAMANSGNQGHGPARNGVFATNSSGRASSGAGFYGHMELSGNCWEVVVAAGTGGTGFTRSEHGDGLLTTLGDANQAGWPEGYSGLNTGITIRGGSWWETSSHIAFLTASYRNPSGLAAARSLNLGIRGCRSAN
ncbi:MAG TPA: SUMF1/EgtB/PvdO family nonheme iron enzyme, partial [Phnomibacter sp.]|nr:SUMF1/EgtB/PvdO family nonheme iron enzyme [Phnomibacter sp.]